MTSLNTMVKQICALHDTTDLNPFENNFVDSIKQMTDDGKTTEHLSEKQIDVIERIYSRHFEGT